MLHRSTLKMLSDLISPKALERILSDAARERRTTLDGLELSALQDILKRDVYRRLQLSVPAALAKRRVQEVLDSLGQEQPADPPRPQLTQSGEDGRTRSGQTEVGQTQIGQTQVNQTQAGQHSQIQALEEQARQFALYFEWPQTQRLRALLGVARQESAAGHDPAALLQEGTELIEALGRQLSEGLVSQGQDLSELKAGLARLSGIGGPQVRRLETLVRQIGEAQESGTLLPAEVERALNLTLKLRKQVESSVVQHLKKTIIEDLPGGSGLEPFDISLLPPEAQARVQSLDREHETRLLAEMAREHAGLLRAEPGLEGVLQALRQRSEDGEVLGEAALDSLRAQLQAGRQQALQQQHSRLLLLGERLGRLQEDQAVLAARQNLSVALSTLEGGALAGDEVAQLSQLVSTLEGGDLRLRERVLGLQRETFELERQARDFPAASGELAPMLAEARERLGSGQLTELEPLWQLLERHMGEAVQQREQMDARAAVIMRDYDQYRHLAGETIQKLGRLADALRELRHLGVLSGNAREHYSQTLQAAEALLGEAEAEFQAAREVTATFGADALSSLLGVFDSGALSTANGGVEVGGAGLWGTVLEETAAPAGAETGSAETGSGAGQTATGMTAGSPSEPPAPGPPADPGPTASSPAWNSDPFGLGALGGAPSAPSTRAWWTERGEVVQGDLSPADGWASEADCEADVLRLAWLAAQAGELSALRLSLEVEGRSWLAIPQPGGRTLVVCGPERASAEEAARREQVALS